MNKKKGRFYIGTSGWSYKHWIGRFYPDDIKSADLLSFYTKKFKTAEINNSFYNLPDKETFKNWRDQAPGEFIFSLKASRYITHMKKLKSPKTSVNKFMGRIEALGAKLGPVLFQLPPRWNCNIERLDNFLEILPSKFRYVFEFRDTSWFNDKVYSLLKKKNAAFCIYQLKGLISPKAITADFVYIRLHGPEGAYEGRYTKRQLAGWAGAISAWLREKKDVYCYFDNDQAAYAPRNALELIEMLI